MSRTGSDRNAPAAPPVSDPEWLARIVRELGDGDLDQALSWRLPDGFDVPAVRGPADTPAGLDPIPGRPGGSPWGVREDLDPEPVDRLAAALEAAAAFGAHSMGLIVRDVSEGGLDSLAAHVSGPVRHLVGGARALVLAERLAASGTLPPGGTLDFDPAAELLRRGPTDGPAEVGRVAELLPPSAAASFRPACADGLTAHLGGATDSTELAVVFASVSSWLDALVVQRGVDPETAASALHVVTSAGILYFPTVARLRATRLGVARVARAYGVSGQGALRIPLHVRTSPRQQTAFDPYGNLLRATVAATAAVVGGCDSLSVTPYDACTVPSERGRRLALVLQAVLREEGRLHLVSDPGAGSWYVESLTARMGDEAWEHFRQIEAEGGLQRSITGGSLVGRIQAEGRAQEIAIDRRERILIGVNRHADPAEVPPAEPGSPRRVDVPGATGMLDFARPSTRLEALRAALHPESAHGHAHPPALLLAFGDAGPCGHRAAVVTDFLSSAGIRVEGPIHVGTADEMIAAVRSSESPIILLCGPEDAFVVFGDAARDGLGGRHAGATLVGVGRPPDDDPGRWFMDSCIDRDTPLLAGLGRILSAAGLRFEGDHG